MPPTRPSADAPTFTAAEIKALRLRMGLSQTAFGQLIHVVQRTIVRWEKGAEPTPLARVTLGEILARYPAPRQTGKARAGAASPRTPSAPASRTGRSAWPS